MHSGSSHNASVAPVEVQVKLEQVHKTYTSKQTHIQALNKVDLTISKGEIFGIIGRSGAGKSTLVRCINMLERPSSGKIWVAGQSMTELDSKALRHARRNIGMIFQHFNLLSLRTVYENVSFPLELGGFPKNKIRERVLSMLDLVGLSEHTHKYVAQISGGQKQRVGIARALANNPSVLLSDEATSALDPETTSSTLSLLKELNQELGLTIILITHQMEVVRRICDRVAVIEQGSIIEEGAVRDVFAYPKAATTKSLLAEATGQTLPKETLHALWQQASDDTHIWLIKNHHPDVITQLVQRFSLHVEILQALVEDYQGVSIGTLLLNVQGDAQAVQNAKNWLKNTGIELEEINHE